MSTPADVVFVAGTIHAPADTRPPPTAAAITNDRISFVGTDEGVAALIGPATELVDLAGRSLLPGFQDSHVHACTAGVELGRCDLLDLEGAKAYLEAIAEYAAAWPELSWIRGKGWAMDAFDRGVPTAAALDRVVPDRPALFTNRDGHGAWVNTVALRLAGIDGTTPDPSDGRIERDQDGRPTGTLHEGAADLVMRHAPPTSQPEIEAGILASQRYLFSLGITAWQDAWVEPTEHEAYVVLSARGDLIANVVGALWWDRHRGLDQLPGLEDRRSSAVSGPYRATSVKIMQDGVVENFTAAMLDPYLDRSGLQTANSGLSFVDPGALGEIVTALDAAAFQVHFHALGDRAVRESLDAVALAQHRNGRSGNRHHLAHLQLVNPSDRTRFAQLGVTANVQPLWAHHDGYQDDLTIPFLGAERAACQYPWRSLLDAGAGMAMGSDWDVSTPNPFEILHVAVERHHPGTADRPVFFPAQRIELDEAITAYTAGSSYVNHRDDAGVIGPGTVADVVVASRSLDEASRDHDLASVTADLTFVAGQNVHEAR